MSNVQPTVNGSNYWVPILGSAIRILEVFFDSESELTLHEISTKAKVGKTSAFRILYTLDKLGYVEKDPFGGKYRLGLRIIAAARKTVAGGNLVQAARAHLKKLRDEFNETINLAVLRNDEIVYLEILESPYPFRMTETVGARIPWHSTALGKSIAAYLPEERVRRILKQSPLKRFTPNTITSMREYMEGLKSVGDQGFSFDVEESELGATCVAAPIFDADHAVIGALSISGASPRIRDKQNKVAQALKNAAAAISRSLQ